jgi:hypothetical protein
MGGTFDVDCTKNIFDTLAYQHRLFVRQRNIPKHSGASSRAISTDYHHRNGYFGNQEHARCQDQRRQI